jgi:hypothetical protein
MRWAFIGTGVSDVMRAYYCASGTKSAGKSRFLKAGTRLLYSKPSKKIDQAADELV